MYRVIGIDGQEYGPVSADEIRRWIAAGRLNAQSKAVPEGASESKPLAEFPEFADALRRGSGLASPGASPDRNPTAEAKTLEAKILASGYTIDPGSCLARAWEKLLADLWPMIGITALIWIALGASHGVYIDRKSVV